MATLPLDFPYEEESPASEEDLDDLESRLWDEFESGEKSLLSIEAEYNRRRRNVR